MNYLRSRRHLQLLLLIAAVLCCLLASVQITAAATATSVAAAAAVSADDDQLDDFAFEGELAKDTILHKAERRSDANAADLGDIDLNGDSFEAADNSEIETGRRTPSNAFAAKEQRIRIALQRATKQGPFTRKFAQILPILRTLNAQQRLVLASLITAQSSAAPGDALNLKQVSLRC